MINDAFVPHATQEMTIKGTLNTAGLQLYALLLQNYKTYCFVNVTLVLIRIKLKY